MKISPIMGVAVAISAVLSASMINAPIASAASGPVFTVMNTSETPPDGVYFRNSPNWNDTSRTYGLGVFKNERVQLECYAFGQAIGPYNDKLWYYVLNVTRPVNYNGAANVGMLNAHYINDGKAANVVDAGVPGCVNNRPPQPPQPTPQPKPQSPSVALTQGSAAPSGYRYAISLSGFAANTSVTISCRDSANPSGFYTFSLITNGSGQASTQGYCYSADGPDHWVLAGGVESNHVTWSGGSSSGGGASGGGGNRSTTSPQPSTSSTPKSSKPSPVGDPCIAAYGVSKETVHSIFGGTETDFDRTTSLYDVCEGFGVPNDLSYSPEMKCALIAAGASFVGPSIRVATARACDALGVAKALATHDWLGGVGDVACGFFADVFADGVGIVVAGAASSTGPVAVALGAASAKALAASLQVACGGLLDGGAATFGYNLEAHHETHVAVDILRKGKCLRERRVFGYISWSAATC